VPLGNGGMELTTSLSGCGIKSSTFEPSGLVVPTFIFSLHKDGLFGEGGWTVKVERVVIVVEDERLNERTCTRDTNVPDWKSGEKDIVWYAGPMSFRGEGMESVMEYIWEDWVAPKVLEKAGKKGEDRVGSGVVEYINSQRPPRRGTVDIEGIEEEDWRFRMDVRMGSTE